MGRAVPGKDRSGTASCHCCFSHPDSHALGQGWPCHLALVSRVVSPHECLTRVYNSVTSPFCPSPWPELGSKNPFARCSRFYNSSSFLPRNTFEPWTFGFEGLKGRVCGMWHFPGFLFHSCFNVQGHVRILLSNFYKLCPSHTHAESSKNKRCIHHGIEVLTYGLSAGLTTTLLLWKLYPDMVSYWNHLTSALQLNKDDNNYLPYILSLHNSCILHSGK